MEGAEDNGGAAADVKPIDDEIMAQETDIRDEINSVPLMGPQTSLDSLKAQYSGNAGFMPKITTLEQSFRAMRRTRPDGSCFYRAYMYGILEQLLGNKEKQAFIADRAKKSLDFCLGVGYEKIAIEDFWEEFCSSVDMVSTEGSTIETLDNVLVENDGYLVCWLRILTSAFLKHNKDEYSAFLTSHPSIEAFCAQEIDPVNTEADHLQIIALSSYLGVPVRVVYLDQSEGDKATEHNFSGGTDSVPSPFPPVCLLYRPGHYDLIYPQ